MGVATNARAGRATRLLLAAQSAYGTPVSNFASATAARAPRLEIDLGTEYADQAFMTAGGGTAAEGAFQIPRLFAGELGLRATPATLGAALRGCWGTPTLGVYAQTSQVATRYSLAFVEDRHAANARKVARLADAWFPAVTLDVNGAGRVGLRIRYAAEVSEVRAGNALSGWTLPGFPMEPGDQNEYAGRAAVLTRDLGGPSEQAIPFRQLSLSIDESPIERWDQSAGRMRSHKAGHARVTVTLSGRVGDESWAALTDARAGTPHVYTLAIPGTETFTATLHNMTWDAGPLDVSGLDYQPFAAVGRAGRIAVGTMAEFSLI
jgi:hypothetical protein